LDIISCMASELARTRWATTGIAGSFGSSRPATSCRGSKWAGRSVVSLEDTWGNADSRRREAAPSDERPLEGELPVQCVCWLVRVELGLGIRGGHFGGRRGAPGARLSRRSASRLHANAVRLVTVRLSVVERPRLANDRLSWWRHRGGAERTSGIGSRRPG
jgi:hypothetical protein